MIYCSKIGFILQYAGAGRAWLDPELADTEDED